MEFRPCIDIHNGKVKQIVGGSLKDAGDQATENFVAEQDAAYFAKLYQRAGREEECRRECEDIKLWFGDGEIVEGILFF